MPGPGFPSARSILAASVELSILLNWVWELGSFDLPGQAPIIIRRGESRCHARVDEPKKGKRQLHSMLSLFSSLSFWLTDLLPPQRFKTIHTADCAAP